MLVFLILDAATLVGILVLNFTKLLVKFPTLFYFNIAFVVISAILFVFSYLAFCEVAKERDRLKIELNEQKQKLEQGTYKGELKIGAEVKSIETYDYYADAEGRGHAGDKLIHLRVVFSPSMPMQLTIVSLKIWNELIDLRNYKKKPQEVLTIGKIAPLLLKNTATYTLLVDVPKRLAITTSDARIYALISNQNEVLSEPFFINFGESK